MEIWLLGSTEISNDGQRIRVSGLKVRTILAILAINISRTVSVDQLINELWPDRPLKNGKNSLHVLMLRLRKVIAEYVGPEAAADLLRTYPAGYALHVPPEALDMYRFTRLVEEARQARISQPHTSLRLYKESLDLWRGPALLDVDDNMTCRLMALGLEESRLSVVEEMFDVQLEFGLYRDVVADLEQYSTRYPLRERLCEQLMTALYGCGRQTEAINAYQRTRRRLITEFGLEPGDAMRSRFEDILRHSVN
jgi:DNA-binding SARP family transcriptional activator